VTPGGVQIPIALYTYPCNGEVCAFRVMGSDASVRLPPEITEVRRVPAGDGGERLVIFTQDFSIGEFPLSFVVAWDGERAGTVQVGYRSLSGFPWLGAATSGSAIVSNVRFEGDIFGPDFRVVQETALATFDRGLAPVVIPDSDLTSEPYTLLPPRYLYNTETLRFHTMTPALRKTAIPAALVEAADAGFGDFHLVTVP
jgi:hypothetical protein